ncbi:hypothetical protein CCACVL1_25576 [Corchorus capsularis]|uniref:Uncharacterized protein n=1 Tax=Corchorus capsularis TaxID=210143 RepID=A0A1R3GJ67_COCAP|nr:hypothetical protein CCACVL1_25576 [Corchorus capsularis]
MANQNKRQRKVHVGNGYVSPSKTHHVTIIHPRCICFGR